MLRSFRFANHRSFRDEQELVLLPAYDQSRPVVPVVAVFGANASGKSNLLDALAWMRRAVLESFRKWEAESGIPRSPFRLDAAAAALPSSYSVDLTIDDVQYTYGFTLDDGVVAEEWLNAYPHNRERVIFARHGQLVELGSTVPERRGRAELLASLLRENSLLLSTAVQAGQDEVLPVYRWFREGLGFAGGKSPSWQVLEQLAQAIGRHPIFVPLLKAADLGIVDVIVDDVELLSGRATADLAYSVRSKQAVFLHGAGKVPLTWVDQSEGTQLWALLLMAALEALQTGAALVVDEVDASLHPRLTARLIELFRHKSTNSRGAQLLFTTHDATLLGTNLGEEVLRRDEIWFVDKRDGASTLYPLSDFHPRKDENRERRYLAGSYGAVPVTFPDSLVDSVLSTRTEPPDAEA